MIWAVALGYFVFGELPMARLDRHRVIVVAGPLILWREQRQLARDRAVSSAAL